MVGTVHPRHRPRPTESHGEMAVWRALSTGLPDGWHAFHSLRLRAGPAHEGEGDFVVAKPDHGLLVVEVKGGRIEQHDGIWLQNGRPLKKAPREQAQRYVRLLLRALETRCGQRVPFGVAACFPDTAFSTGPSDGDLHGIVIGELDLPHLGELLPRIFDAVVPRGNAPRDAAAWIEALRQLWAQK